jgi:LysM repeat protein
MGLATVAAIAIGIATLFWWQEPLLTAQAAQNGSIYVVEKGDSLHSIAQKLGVRVETLAAANNLPVNTILLRKQELIIPTSNGDHAMTMADTSSAWMADATAEATEEATEEVWDEVTDTPTEEAWVEATPVPTEEMADVATMVTTMVTTPSAANETYKVTAGDSLHSIAKKFHISVEALAAANGLQPNTILLRGQILIIPSRTAPVAVATTAPIAPPADAWTIVTATVTTTVTTTVTATATAEPIEETAEEATEEATAEATPEPTEEATPEPTEEMMEEATPEATEDATEEAMEEATPEATAEAMEEATAEATPTPTE